MNQLLQIFTDIVLSSSRVNEVLIKHIDLFCVRVSSFFNSISKTRLLDVIDTLDNQPPIQDVHSSRISPIFPEKKRNYNSLNTIIESIRKHIIVLLMQYQENCYFEI